MFCKKRLDNLNTSCGKGISNYTIYEGSPIVSVGVGPQGPTGPAGPSGLPPSNISEEIVQIDTGSDIGSYYYSIEGVIKEDDQFYWIDQKYYVNSSTSQEGIINIVNPLIVIIRTGNKVGIHLTSHEGYVQYGLKIEVIPITLSRMNLTIKVPIDGIKNVYYSGSGV